MPTDTSALTEPSKGKRFQVLAGAILVQLILGTVYGYSIFWEPLTSNIFPAVITEAQNAAQIATGTLKEGTIVVMDDAAAFTLAAELCLLSAGLAIILHVMTKRDLHKVRQ